MRLETHNRVIECHSDENEKKIKCRIKCSESRVIQTYEFSLKCALFSVPCYSICRLHDAAPNAAIIISDCIKQG